MMPQKHRDTPYAVLDVRNLRIGFGDGPSVVDGIDLSIYPGQILCLVGQSGSGKSLMALALMRLAPRAARVSADRLCLDGTDVLTAAARDLEALRGDRVAMVFQDQSLALNPVMTIGDQIAEALQTHRPVSRPKARMAALAMLDRVQMPGGDERLGLFAHQLSGGMRQRVQIAMDLICQPRLLIADEPTSSLDAVLQRQIVRLIRDLGRDCGAAVLLITHDLMLAQEVADEIAVIFAGQIVERGPRDQIFDNPSHPCTLALLAALAHEANLKPVAIEAVPGAKGCRFQRRCPVVADICLQNRPPLVAAGVNHSVACWRAPLEDALT